MRVKKQQNSSMVTAVRIAVASMWLRGAGKRLSEVGTREIWGMMERLYIFFF